MEHIAPLIFFEHYAKMLNSIKNTEGGSALADFQAAKNAIERGDRKTYSVSMKKVFGAIKNSTVLDAVVFEPPAAAAPPAANSYLPNVSANPRTELDRLLQNVADSRFDISSLSPDILRLFQYVIFLRDRRMVSIIENKLRYNPADPSTAATLLIKYVSIIVGGLHFETQKLNIEQSNILQFDVGRSNSTTPPMTINSMTVRIRKSNAEAARSVVVAAERERNAKVNSGEPASGGPGPVRLDNLASILGELASTPEGRRILNAISGKLPKEKRGGRKSRHAKKKSSRRTRKN